MKTKITIVLLLCKICAFAQWPTARNIANMTYDDNNKQILMYGGHLGSQGFADDLWALKGMQWTKLGDGGPQKLVPAFAFDPNRKKLVLFGGSGTDGQSDETWEWDGKIWSNKEIAGPPARAHCKGTYDYDSKQVIIFGGYGKDGKALNDTWAYDGNSWKLLNSDGPADCLPHGMFYDDTRKHLMLITLANKGNPDDDNRRQNILWQWANNTWQKLPDNLPATTGRSLQALAPALKGSIVLFDGDDINNKIGKTWSNFNGNWIGKTIEGPSAPRIAHVMVFNKQTRQTILFGGTDRTNNMNDLWAWNGKKWEKLN